MPIPKEQIELVTRRARILVARWSRNPTEYLELVQMLGLAPGSEDQLRTEITLRQLRNWSGPTNQEKKL